jgi:hypothetical protein
LPPVERDRAGASAQTEPDYSCESVRAREHPWGARAALRGGRGAQVPFSASPCPGINNISRQRDRFDADRPWPIGSDYYLGGERGEHFCKMMSEGFTSAISAFTIAVMLWGNLVPLVAGCFEAAPAQHCGSRPQGDSQITARFSKDRFRRGPTIGVADSKSGQTGARLKPHRAISWTRPAIAKRPASPPSPECSTSRSIRRAPARPPIRTTSIGIDRAGPSPLFLRL